MRLLLLLPGALAVGLAAQAVPEDAGVLLIHRGDRIVAEEEFAVRRDGATLTVTSTVRWGEATHLILAVWSPRRVTVRVSGAEGEIAREFPAGGTLILDDSTFVFLVLLPQHDPGTVRIARPRATERGPGTLRDLGAVDGERQLSLDFEGGAVRAWFQPDGRFIRAEIPDRNLTITRGPAPPPTQ